MVAMRTDGKIQYSKPAFLKGERTYHVGNCVARVIAPTNIPMSVLSKAFAPVVREAAKRE